MSGGLPWRPGPTVAKAPTAGVDVWRVALDDPGWRSAGTLSPPEQERAERLLDGPVRSRWGASRRGLRAVLGRYLDGGGLPEEFVLGPHGKPALPGPGPALRFNLSHSGDLALIAVVARREVGIDVERVDAARDVASLATHGLDREAAAAVLATPPAERALAFYRAWVRREAIGKCGGEGLGDGAPAEGVEVRWIEPADGFVAALAVAPEIPDATLRCFTVDPG
jgi:4'-phosphopantetheinyl transferase